MRLLLANVLLALVWAMTIGDFTPANFAVGFGVGYAVLWLGAAQRRQSVYFQKVNGFILFTIYFFKELLVANLKMARYTLTPLSQLKPGILSIPIRPDMTDTEVTVLANMITLTPGTLSMDISADRTTLFVHFMHMDDPEAQRREIVEGFERRLLELTR